jgi:hypothetical protein
MIEVVLNDSLIVSGLFLEQTTRKQWLRDVTVTASGDNITFLDWGNYSATNWTEASTILFPLPVRARVFRITVFNYIHHWLNHTGFPFSAQAIVATREPFTCGCPMLSSGECCPRQNMRVWQDQCYSCMDPNSLNVMIVDGCGICKPGTVERWGKCVTRAGLSPQGGYGLVVGTVLAEFPELKNVVNDSRRWTVQMEISSLRGSVYSIFLIDEPMPQHPCGDALPSFCCLIRYFQTHVVLMPFADGTINTSATQFCAPQLSALVPNTDHQFFQYDRGRYSVSMSSQGIRTWAQCVRSSTCTGYVGVLFAQPFADIGRFSSHIVYHPIELEFVAPPFIVATFVQPSLPALGVSFHRFQDASVQAQITGVQFDMNQSTVQWGDENATTVVNVSDTGYMLPATQTRSEWRMMRIQGTATNGKPLSLAAARPMRMAQHDAVIKTDATMVTADIFYGLSLATNPVPGDSERVMTFVSTSVRVRRLLRLQVRYGMNENFAMLANARGMIMFPDHVIDMGIACQDRDSLLVWLERHTELFGARTQFNHFIDRVCALALDEHNRVFCMVPLAQKGLNRNDIVRFEILADFG